MQKISFAFVSNLSAKLWEIKVELLCLLINNVSLDFFLKNERKSSQKQT